MDVNIPINKLDESSSSFYEEYDIEQNSNECELDQPIADMEKTTMDLKPSDFEICLKQVDNNETDSIKLNTIAKIALFYPLKDKSYKTKARDMALLHLDKKKEKLMTILFHWKQKNS